MSFEESWAEVFGPSDPAFPAKEALLALKASVDGVHPRQVEKVDLELVLKEVEHEENARLREAEANGVTAPVVEAAAEDFVDDQPTTDTQEQDGTAESSGEQDAATGVGEEDEGSIVDPVIPESPPEPIGKQKVTSQPETKSPVTKRKTQRKGQATKKTKGDLSKAKRRVVAPQIIPETSTRSQPKRAAAQVAAQTIAQTREESPVPGFGARTEQSIIDDMAAHDWAGARSHLPAEQQWESFNDPDQIREYLKTHRLENRKRKTEGLPEKIWGCRCTFSLDLSTGVYTYGLTCDVAFLSKDNVERHISCTHMGKKRK